ncbi:MAG: hypothetical protein M0P39_13260 [Rhodocyclaceae bacterium]|jgi:uncharacterized low-complexity protein|nr:hypothetical protein [Rhodocyclaceae bacterium]
MKKKTMLSVAVGTAFAASAALVPLAHAEHNPFRMQTLSSGYLLAEADAKTMEATPEAGKKMDGSCGGAKKKDGSCGDKKAAKKAEKKKDGSCGGEKRKDGSCGAGKKMEMKKDGTT